MLGENFPHFIPIFFGKIESPTATCRCHVVVGLVVVLKIDHFFISWGYSCTVLTYRIGHIDVVVIVVIIVVIVVVIILK